MPRKAPFLAEPFRRVPARARLALGLLLAALACDPSALLGPDAPQGIEGLVLLGPLCPVSSVDDPCPDRPYSARIGVLTEGGTRLTTVRSGEDGHFRVGLEPGRYVLQPEQGDPLPASSDEPVTVVAGRYTEVTIHYDTGIR